MYNLVAKFVHGSHLYKLNTPDSDLDYKGVYVPSLKEIFLGNYKDSINLSTNKSNNKNSSDDIDYEVYSINKFVNLLTKGEMVTFDMLFAPEECVVYYDRMGGIIDKNDKNKLKANLVYDIRQNYSMFVHSDMKAYMGYLRRQAAKYGIKGSRLASLRLVDDYLNSIIAVDEQTRISDIIHKLPENEYLVKDKEHYEVLSKKHQLTTRFYDFAMRIKSEMSKYGNRAILAEKNEGIDWKAISHAFRAGYQILSMLENSKMDVVLEPNIREYILDVKAGKLDWIEVKHELEELMNLVELTSNSNHTLRKKPDYEEIQDYLANLVMSYYDFS